MGIGASTLMSWRLGVGTAGLLAVMFAGGLVKGQGTAAEVQPRASFCTPSGASDLVERFGETPPARGIKLAVSKEEVKAGEVVKARLLNFDEEKSGTYGAEFKIQRFGSTGWETDPSSPAGPWLRYLGKLQPGEAGRCYTFSVPAEQDSGRYRFSTKIRISAKQLGKTGEFNVQ
jgi:hypothetical protein